MVVGIDSYHDSAAKGRSVGAFIASMNASLTRFYSRCTFQHNMQELMDGLKVAFTGRLCMKTCRRVDGDGARPLKDSWIEILHLAAIGNNLLLAN